MKATGEVMAIGGNFEESLLKAIDSLDMGLNYHLGMKKIASWEDSKILSSLENPDDERIFVVCEALRRGYSVDKIQRITNIDKFFIERLKNITLLGQRLEAITISDLDRELLWKCKKYGFGNSYIASLINASEETIEELCRKYDIAPSYRPIDNWLEKNGNKSPYFYSCYSSQGSKSARQSGSAGFGPIRTGIEFDYYPR